MGSKRMMGWVARVSFAGMVASAVGLGSGCAEAIESALCKSASNKICDKWFNCWPLISEALWVTPEACRVSMNSFCDESESWTGCDVDNESLRECDQGIEGSPCGSLPPACSSLKDCYDAN